MKRTAYRIEDTYYCWDCAENIGFSFVEHEKRIEDFRCECEDPMSCYDMSKTGKIPGKNNTVGKLKLQESMKKLGAKYGEVLKKLVD